MEAFVVILLGSLVSLGYFQGIIKPKQEEEKALKKVEEKQE